MVIIFSFSSNRIQLDTMLNHDVFFIFIFMRVQTVKTKKKSCHFTFKNPYQIQSSNSHVK